MLRRNIVKPLLLRYHENSAELALLKEQLEASLVELAPVQKARLEVLRSAKKRKNEADQLNYQAKRQKKKKLQEEAARVESRMMKLLVSSGKIYSSKLN